MYSVIQFQTAAGESYPNDQNVNQAECEASVCNSAGQPVNNLLTAGNYLLSSQGVTSQNSHQINGTNCFVCPTSMSWKCPEVSHKHNADHVSNSPQVHLASNPILGPQVLMCVKWHQNRMHGIQWCTYKKFLYLYLTDSLR